MPFRKHFDKLLDKLDGYNAPPPVPSYNKPMPSVPFASKPPPQYDGSSQQPQIYWQPRFDPSVPVSQNFRHETGDHGWGNNEAENYTDQPQNSFHTPQGALVLRALASSRHSDSKQRYTSARLTSHQLLARQRGYLEARISGPVAAGIWPAFWLLPCDPFVWPYDGEVDIMEFWNGERLNHSCLHWGQHNGEDWDKHQVVQTQIPDLESRPGGHVFGFAWDQPQPHQGDEGRCIWYIDGNPVMKAKKPRGTRPFEDWRILLNIAMGGNVCKGQIPADGCYDMVVHELKMCDSPWGGWGKFEGDWNWVREGRPV